MRGSEFAATFGPRGLSAWENAAVDLARSGGLLPPAYVPVAVSGGGLTGTVFITSDVLSVGEPGDYLRLPLTPGAGQAIANLMGGALLPTRKLAKDTWAFATKKMVPLPLTPNKGADMGQYVQHSALIDEQLRQASAEPGELVSGIKKDVVVSNAMKPGKVVIYGWIRPDGSAIQPLSNVHGDFYVDYSHGVRLVAPTMQVDGMGTVATEDVYRDPRLSALVSDEGPLQTTRYSTSVKPAPAAPPSPPSPGAASFTSIFMRGLQAIVFYAERTTRQV